MRVIKTDTVSEAREIAGKLVTFRAPHYTTSAHGVVDELRLASGGVLYLDEVPSFSRGTLEALASAIRSGKQFGAPLPLAIMLDNSAPHIDLDAEAWAERVSEVADALENAAKDPK